MLKIKRKPLYKPEIINAMRGYKKRHILNDLFAGFMIALVALPLNFAMGMLQVPDNYLIGLQIGMWSAIVGGLLLSIFGGTRFSIGGPTAPFIAVIVVLFTFSGIGLTEVFFTVALAGIILIVAGLLKAGKLLKFISYPALMGICLGIGVTLLFSLFSNLGFTQMAHTYTTQALQPISPFLASLIRMGGGITDFRFFDFLLGAIAVAITYLLPKLHKKIPSAIIAIVAVTLISLFFMIPSGANISGNFAAPTLIGGRFTNTDPAWGSHFLNFGALNFGAWQMYLFAFAIAIIAALEGMTSATAVGNISGIKYSANAELVGHGVANLGSGLLGGLPVTAAMARTNMNYESGAKSNFAGIFHAIFLLLFYALLMRFMGFIPMAALAAPLVKVAISTSFFPLAIRLLRFTRRDTAIIVVTGLVTIIFGVHFGVIAGVVLAFAVNGANFKKKLKIEVVSQDLEVWLKEEAKTQHLKIYGSLFFANCHKLTDKIVNSFKSFDEIIVDMSSACSLDATAVERLAKLTKRVALQNKHLRVINLSEKQRRLFTQAFSFIVKSWA